MKIIILYQNVFFIHNVKIVYVNKHFYWVMSEKCICNWFFHLIVAEHTIRKVCLALGAKTCHACLLHVCLHYQLALLSVLWTHQTDPIEKGSKLDHIY